jgi:hypothetical protein
LHIGELLVKGGLNGVLVVNVMREVEENGVGVGVGVLGRLFDPREVLVFAKDLDVARWRDRVEGEGALEFLTG